MTHEIHLKRSISIILILFLVVLAAIILRPIFLAVVTGLLLGYIFNPLYGKVLKFVKEKNTSAFLIIFLVFVIIFVPFWFLFPVVIKQVFEIFLYLQNVDLVAYIKHLFPAGLFNNAFYTNLSAGVSGFIGNIAGAFTGSFSSFIINLPSSILQVLIILFSLFYSLKDSEKFGSYIKSISPFTDKTEKRILSEFRNITNSVIYGSILTSIIMGLLIGAGFFIFRAPNALLLTIIAIIAGMLPILGMWMVWLPTAIYLYANNHPTSALLLIIYSLIITILMEGIFRTYYIAKTGKMHNAIALIGMIGGLFAFGVIGFILGPLILSYLIILFDLYRNKELSTLFE